MKTTEKTDYRSIYEELVTQVYSETAPEELDNVLAAKRELIMGVDHGITLHIAHEIEKNVRETLQFPPKRSKREVMLSIIIAGIYLKPEEYLEQGLTQMQALKFLATIMERQGIDQDTFNRIHLEVYRELKK